MSKIYRHILALDLDKINLDDDSNFDGDDPDTIIYRRILVRCSKLTNKVLKEKD